MAPTEANVLITGESGTGKEQVARAIHGASRRRDKRFNVINCAAIPEGLLESTPFGHKRGSFTGADRDHAGLLGFSDGGTVFFDEVGELPLAFQVKLLRVIQERSFVPVGGEKEITVDIRILAASNRDLREEVRQGRFREDLYYRLDVVPIPMPPLRQRPDDIEALVYHFLDEFSEQFPHVQGFTREAVDRIVSYGWPGNVRELHNAVERAVSLTQNDTIGVQDLPEPVRNTPAAPPHRGLADQNGVFDTWDAVQHDYFSRLLAFHEGNVSRAAQDAGISRKILNRLSKNIGLDPRAFRNNP